MVASAVLVEYTRGVNLRMASANVEAAQLFLRQQDVKERRLQRLIKSADLKMVGLQDGLRMREEEIIAVEKSEAADKIEQLERLAGLQDALTIDLEPLQLHSADLQMQLHELRMASLSSQHVLQHHEAQSSPSSLTTTGEGNELRPDPVTAETLASQITEQVQNAAETPLPGAEAVPSTDDAVMALLAEQTVHGITDGNLDDATLHLPGGAAELKLASPVLRLVGRSPATSDGTTGEDPVTVGALNGASDGAAGPSTSPKSKGQLVFGTPTHDGGEGYFQHSEDHKEKMRAVFAKVTASSGAVMRGTGGPGQQVVLANRWSWPGTRPCSGDDSTVRL